MESTGQRQAAKVANERIHDYTAAGLSAEGQDPPNVKASKDVPIPDDPEEQRAAAELDRDALGDDDKEVARMEKRAAEVDSAPAKATDGEEVPIVDDTTE
jgi:hypothetical protein